MLKFILGKSGSGKTTTIFNDIKARIKNETKVLLVVPEQYSYETEQKVLREFGVDGAALVNATSFSRFSKRLLEENSVTSNKHADDITKLLVMSLAVKEVSDNLSTYKNQSESINFYTDALSVCKEFEDNQMTACDVIKMLEDIEGATKEKLNDIALIYSAYEGLLQKRGISLVSDISLACDYIKDSNVLEEYSAIYFDGFKSFTADEIKMLEAILSFDREVYVSLCTLPEFLGKNTIFQTPSETYIMLSNICDELKIKYEIYKLLDESMRVIDESVEYFGANIFKNNISEFDKENTGVSVIKAPDMDKECKFICAKIRELILTGEYSYKDIALVGRNIEKYIPSLEASLKMYDIPYFLNYEESVLKSSLALFIISAFEAVTFNTEKVLSFAKTGYLGLTLEEVSKLENYCYVWDIKNRLWLSDFTSRKHSDSKSLEERYISELEEINKIRRKIVEPLKVFGEKVKNANGRDISKAVYTLILNFKVKETIATQVAKLLADSKEAEARILRQAWDRVVDTLEAMNTVLGDNNIGYKNYLEMFRQALLKTSLASPPQYIDTVTIADAGLVRLSDLKVVFLFGVNEGAFPADDLSCSLLSPYERKKLNDAGFNFLYPDLKVYNEERFVAYEAISAASDNLFITYSLADSSYKELYPSLIVNQAKAMFSDCETETNSYDAEFYCSTKEALFEYCASNFYVDDENSATARKSAQLVSGLSEKCEMLKVTANRPEHHIYNRELMNRLAGDDVYISATRMEDYYSCKFYHFCKYGLKLRQLQTVEIDSRLAGSLLHYCLECILKEHFDELLTLSEGKIISLAKEIINEYIDVNCGGTEDKSNSYKNKLGRFAKRVAKIINHLQKEFSQCDFVPVGFETSIGKNEDVEPEIIKSGSGKNIFVNGKIDRIDLYEFEDKKYIRVIDYKSSKKKMLLGELKNGHNLQMILYLFILTSSENSAYKGAIPAGAFYSSLAELKINNDNNTKGTAEEIEKKNIDNFALNGLILDDEVSLNAMQKGDDVFIHIDKNMIANLEEMTYLKVYCKKMIKGMVDEFTFGEISALPTETNDKYIKCSYCEYFDICGKEGKVDIKKYKALKKAEFYTEEEA